MESPASFVGEDSPLRKVVLTLLLVATGLLSIAALPILQPAKAPSTSTINLYGRVFPSPNGWGFTATTVTDPGPTVVTTPGGTVSLNLFAGDSILHQFCVDYDPDFACNTPSEPQSATFSSSTNGKPFSFIATSIPGNYTYFCTIHTTAMVGTLVVRAPHDVAVSNLALSRNFSYNNVPANPLKVNVTAQNPGNNTETFAVSAKANSTLIGTQTITLAAGATRIVSFNWTNTQALARGNYILTANATKVNGEIYFLNNQFTYSITFVVMLKGDVNADCKVDIADLATVGATFGKTIGSPGFKPAADLNNDGTINIVDLVLVAGSFGQAC